MMFLRELLLANADRQRNSSIGFKITWTELENMQAKEVYICKLHLFNLSLV